MSNNGLCKCGCGQKTTVCRTTRLERGQIKGQPLPFLPWHGRRKHPFTAEYFKQSDGCWIRLGCNDDKGYGRHYANGDKKMAHEVVYEELAGPIPDDKFIDHKCRNKSCVNPAHLRIATRSQNSANTPKLIGTKRQYTSVYKGVARVKNKWKAYICLGTFDSERQAAEACNKAAKSVFGEFACLNKL